MLIKFLSFYFIGLFLILETDSKKYKVVCSSNIFCGSKLMAKYTSDTGKIGYQCVPTSGILGCPTLTTEFNIIENCSKDQRGNTCSAKLCVAQFPIEHCVIQLNGDPCPSILDGRSDSVQCKNCEVNSNCQKCIFAFGQEACFSENQCPMINFVTTYGTCTGGVDTYGSRCQCCAKTMTNVQSNVCSNLAPLFKTNTFANLYNPDGGNNEGGNNEGGNNEGGNNDGGNNDGGNNDGGNNDGGNNDGGNNDGENNDGGNNDGGNNDGENNDGGGNEILNNTNSTNNNRKIKWEQRIIGISILTGVLLSLTF